VNDSRARIAVVGAGSVGCFIGGHLGEHADVCLIGRERVRRLIADHGMLLTDLDGGRLQLDERKVRFDTGMQALGDTSLVLVTVKSGDTAAAARQMASRIAPGAVVVSFQNGLRNVPTLREHLPHHIVLAGMVPFNVLHLGHGRLHRASSGTLMVGRDEKLRPFEPVFRAAGLALELRDDMREVQWGKLLLNLNNPINALSDLPLRDQLALRPYRRCLARVQREALRAMDAAGIRPARVTPLPARWMPWLLEAPDLVFRMLARRMLAIDPLARSSTWEDMAAGRSTEIDDLNGEVVRLAKAQGLTAPANARLIELVRAAEKGDRRVWHRMELWNALREAGR
jgi:2-dehydropantoate 2-reductase